MVNKRIALFVLGVALSLLSACERYDSPKVVTPSLPTRVGPTLTSECVSQ